MALSANTVWEIQTGGSDNNGGGFVTGASGTDRSQQTSAQATLTVLSVVAATTTNITVSLTDYTVSTTDVGNILQITGGTATAGFYQITAVNTGTNVWTLDRSAGTTGQTVVGKMGGALVSIGKIGSVILTGNIVYMKNGTYTISSASTNVSGGVVSNSISYIVIGYGTTRSFTNTDTKPVLQFSASGITMFSDRAHHYNLDIDGNSQTTSAGTGGFGGSFDNCIFRNLTAANSSSSVYTRCLGTGNSAAIFAGPCFACEAYGNTATPYGAIGTYVYCLSYDNTGGSTDGFSLGISTGGYISNCIAYNNGRDGFRVFSGRGLVILNCHSDSNAAYGFNINSINSVSMINCSHYNNTSGGITGTNNTTQQINTIAVTAGSPFVDASTHNFALNSTASRGVLLRATGYPGLFPRGTTTGYLDIGPTQHADPASGGVILPRSFNGF